MSEFTKLRYSDLVVESPQHVPSTNFIFDKPDKNRAFAAKMLRKEVEPIEDTPEYRLFLTGSARNGWIVMVNKRDQRTDFAMRFVTGSRPWLDGWIARSHIQLDSSRECFLIIC